MKIGICDDFQKELHDTEKICAEYLSRKNLDAEIVCFADWHGVTETQLDILLLDIEMPEKNGIQVMELLEGRERPLIIFVTGYEKYMPRAFGQNVIGFVRKPVEWLDFSMCMDKAVRILRAGKQILLEEGYSVSTETIRMFVSDQRYTKAVFARGGEKTMLAKSLADWEKDLDDVYFIRINHSQLVNCKYIVDFYDYTVEMDTGEKLKVSRRKKKDCRDRFIRYCERHSRYV